MSQLEVANILKVNTNTITGWELNWHQPSAKMAKRIIEFIGYYPFNPEKESFGMKLYHARLVTGMTQRQLSNYLYCDQSNLRHIELDLRMPNSRIRSKIIGYFEMHSL